MTYPKRLIEVDLPIKQISAHARRDKNKPKGHLHRMHVWWATRPLASCRAVTLATMLLDPVDEACPQSFRDQAAEALHRFTGRDLSRPLALRQAMLDFVGDFAEWNAGVNPTYLEAARKLVAAAHPDGAPMVLDPFAGAGSIPFEALRLGAQSFAGDLNPVAILLNKVSQEYLPRYGERLTESVSQWGEWVLIQARTCLRKFYPVDQNGNVPLAYIWARCIRCEGPGCGAEVPLIGMLWLSQRTNNRAAMRYTTNSKSKHISVDVFSPRATGEVQQPISKRFAVTCPLCGYTTPYKNVREQVRVQRGGTDHARMLAAVTISPSGARGFRSITEADVHAAADAAGALADLAHSHEGDLSLVPDEPTPEARGPGASRAFSIRRWGMESWSDVYLPRQALSLSTFSRLVKEAHQGILDDTGDVGLSDAVATCIGLAVSNTTPYMSGLSLYLGKCLETAFKPGMALPMRGDFAEANPLIGKLVGGVEYSLRLVDDFLKREAHTIPHAGTVQRASATMSPLPDDSVAYLITDPPYYDAIPYADLSDFCYVWLKRSLGSIHKDLLASKVTPKAEECILDPGPPAEGDESKDKQFFERTMEKALSDGRRVLTPDGLAVVVFAHKGTAGWEALLTALVNAGWTVTASWPIDTERAARMRALNSAALGSSVHLVCRPRENPDGSLRADDVGDWRDVLTELPRRIQEWMPRLTSEGVVGADAIFACLGPALEIFSRYSRVEKASGEEVSLRDYLEQVWAAVAQEALRMLFEGADTSAFEEDARLTAMWLWTLKTADNGNGDDEDEEAISSGGYVLEYDAARKIAQGLGAHLDGLPSLVAVKGDEARLLPVDERSSHLFGKEKAPSASKKKRKQRSLFEELDEAEAAEGGWGEGGAPSLGQTTLDRVHQAMLLFASGRSTAMRRFLVEEGAGRDGRFWTLAQALSALYPPNTQEKRWVDGVLARKKSMGF